MALSFRSRITGILTCATAVGSFVSLRFARSVFLGMLERSGTADAALSNLAIFALGVTRPSVLLPFVLVCLAAVAAAEVAVKTEASRLLVQVGVLMVVAILATIALSGFFISFHIPQVRIP